MGKDLETSSHQNFAPKRIIDCKTKRLTAVTEISGGAESAIEGGKVVMNLLSVRNDGFAADSQTAVISSSWYK